MKNEQFTSFDGTVLACYLWDDVKSPKGVVQIAHGMAEHATRYDDFAKFLNANGFIVFADDHRAHGATSPLSPNGNKGFHPGDIYNDTVRDEVEITKMLKDRFGLPVVYLGHSYGSMVGQRYIEESVDHVGAILCGSACQKGALLSVGCMLANCLFGKDGDKRADSLDKITFGAYNKPYVEEGDFGWLSRDRKQVEKYIADDECGYVMTVAFFKYFLNGLKASYNKENLAKIDVKKPIALFSGDHDPVGGNGKLVEKLYEQYHKLGVENLSITLYEGARHEILNEVNNADVYADFLEKINEFVG
ncbi:MAG: alpha/beta hydrolase [Clostridia bacterium]|nr:alpha/beta hydrolase [Clostridia bacterium]